MEPAKAPQKSSAATNISMALIASQSGCVTILIVVLAVAVGLWLDARFDTKPFVTIAAVIISIPISVLVMLKLVRTAVSKIVVEPKTTHSTLEETQVGRNKDN